MPFLREKFTTFHDFALASLSDIYTESCLNGALRLSVTTAESGILINDGPNKDGSSKFRFSPLPRLAQVAPSFGVQFVHANNDCDIDLVLAQNSFSPQRETGRMDGGLSLLLVGSGDGTFRPVWPQQSGISVAQDAKSLVSFDVNEDGWQDLIVAANDGPVQTFLHRKEQLNALSVDLQGAAGNATGTGAQLKIVPAGGLRNGGDGFNQRVFVTKCWTACDSTECNELHPPDRGCLSEWNSYDGGTGF